MLSALPSPQAASISVPVSSSNTPATAPASARITLPPLNFFEGTNFDLDQLALFVECIPTTKNLKVILKDMSLRGSQLSKSNESDALRTLVAQVGLKAILATL
ncbi:hypothetical protein BGZ99_009411 [Dissophora globulifera]|uniref:Uncharacterized protein n=1 Tax=Dissophora globulifera TaxID=979702 RepID=A0A9P6RU83_9FUNG|nr:hypothetical protein BGZ99_009411 [Dissophora globulifera]